MNDISYENLSKSFVLEYMISEHWERIVFAPSMLGEVLLHVAQESHNWDRFILRKRYN